MIPRRIHYCWFGRRPLPLQAKRCMASWAYHLPDYELVRWDESNFDPASHPFTAAAYAAGRYAFVSDYVRMLVLGSCGGIYLDVDVEVRARFDELMADEFFIGLEDRQRFATSIIGAVEDYWLPQAMLEYYDRMSFDDRHLAEMVNVNQVSRLLLEYGFSGEDSDQMISAAHVLRIGRLADAKGGASSAVKQITRHLYAGTWRKRHDKTLVSRLARGARKLPEHIAAWAVLQRYRLAIALRR
ncbi:mannosyltransferase [Stutzerimonas sp. VN223-3]|uniref:glycosyltransferase family 32 protein n=1 Tax=Stutzerimonas sp. VN223-3 TaxID=3384601 RepID=UPI0038B4FEFB